MARYIHFFPFYLRSLDLRLNSAQPKNPVIFFIVHLLEQIWYKAVPCALALLYLTINKKQYVKITIENGIKFTLQSVSS